MLRALAVGFGALSFANLSWQGFDIELGPIVGWMLALHESAFDGAFDLIEPAVVALASLAFDWLNVDLGAHWKHFVTLSWLYIGADAKNAWTGNWKGAKTTAVTRIGFGVPVALAAGAASGAVPDTSIFVAVAVIGGFVLYRLFYALRYAYERKGEGFPFWPELAEKGLIALQIAIAGAAIVAAGYWLQTQPIAAQLGNVPLVTIDAAIAALIGYHLFLGWSNAEPTRRPTETLRQSFLRQGNTKLSLAMGQAVLTGAVLVAIGGAGV
jgi:hypothetical protein